MEGKAMLYESLLYLYYDEETSAFLNRELVGVIDGFVEFCKTGDIVNNTNIAETMGIVYSSRNRSSGGEHKNKLALSDSSLYRFRVRLIRSLDKFISNNFGDKN